MLMITAYPMKQILPLALLVIATTTIRAQCVESNLAGSASEAGSFEVGQSFIAPCSGALEYVEFFSPNSSSISGTFNVRNGSTISSTPIYSQAYTNVPVGPNGAVRITLTGTQNLFGGLQYTVSMEMNGTVYGAGNPYGGGRFWLSSFNIPQFATRDLNFNISIDPNCTNTTSTITENACFNYLSPSGMLWDSSGVYQDTIFNAAGCDSIMTINLTVTDVDVSVTDNGGSLTANATGSTYQWIEDCQNNQDTIPGATDQTFVPTATGFYAVWVTTNGCTNLSNCIQVIVSDVEENRLENMRVFPNPVKDQFQIQGLRADDRLEIHSASGQLMPVERSGTLIHTDGWEQGSYHLTIIGNDGSMKTIRLVLIQ